MAQSADTVKMGAPPPYFAQHTGAQPPPPGFYPPLHANTVITTGPVPQQQQTAHIVVTTATVMNSHYPMRISCPHCRADVTTSIDYEPGCMTHLVAFGLCIIGCIPCCLIPYCVDGMKDTTHKCPACGRHIAIAKRM